MRRNKPTTSRLDLYQRAFADSNGPTGDHICLRIDMTPGDEIVKVTIRIPSRIIKRRPSCPLVEIATRRPGLDHVFAPAITDLIAQGAASAVECRRVGRSSTDSRVEILCAGWKTAGEPDLEVKFLAWELATPLQGDAPYVKATLELLIDFPAFPDVPVLLTIVVPRDTEPRSIQGTHVLAYPSRTFDGRRYLNLYFRRDQTIRTSASFGPTNDVADIWLGFAKLAGAAALVAFVTSLKAAPGDIERLLVVLASLATLLGVASELARQFAELRIYRHVGRSLQTTLLASQAAVAVVIVLSLLRYRNGSSSGIYSLVIPLALALAGGMAAVTLVGLVLHRLGYWHRFVCDFEGCTAVFKIRADRPECRYTGRVFCDDHVDTICGACCHGVDLRADEPTTANRFEYHTIPCRSLRSSGHSDAAEVRATV